ncbi:MAG: hypothetical protein IJK71_08545 [Clostridia bacterium]|nr:hypothetical protein [Clostridia bacterium]
MYLPPSNNLAIDTLSSIFSDMSESYKIFWFNSIVQGVAKGTGTGDSPRCPLFCR